MLTVDDLQAEVVDRYRRLDLPSWPMPRPVGASPKDDEYSRVSNPGRYRVVEARATTWADVLAARLGRGSLRWAGRTLPGPQQGGSGIAAFASRRRAPRRFR